MTPSPAFPMCLTTYVSKYNDRQPRVDKPKIDKPKIDKLRADKSRVDNRYSQTERSAEQKGPLIPVNIELAHTFG